MKVNSWVRLSVACCAVGFMVAASANEGEGGGAAAANGMSFENKLKACGACHGENGDKPLAPGYPILAGQYADYIAQALHEYQLGRRQNPIMGAQVKALALTDSDIKKLAQYFASKQGLRNIIEPR